MTINLPEPHVMVWERLIQKTAHTPKIDNEVDMKGFQNMKDGLMVL